MKKVNAGAKAVTVFDLLDKPEFEDEKNLDDERFEAEFSRLNSLLEEHGMDVSFNREREDRLKYNFIPKELFEHETTFMPVKGMITGFLYEEFHPDHELDVTNLTNGF
ncbi:MAG TPA: hypothetical protein VIJ75_06760 [Hanamia sp.]